MKWLFGVLLLFNAGLFLWATGHKPKTTDFIRPPVNGETMVLLSEMTPVNVTGMVLNEEPSATAVKETDGEKTITQVIEEAKSPDMGSSGDHAIPPPGPPPFCLRVGPFFEEKLAGETAGRLRTISLVVDVRKVKAREIRAYRVYLGPFGSTDEITKQKKVLTDGGVKDFYVKKEEGKKDIISLGLFTQSDGADALTEQLKEKGVTVQIRPEDRKLDPTFWLELTDSNANRAAYDELAAAKTWGDKRTKLSEFPCS